MMNVVQAGLKAVIAWVGDIMPLGMRFSLIFNLNAVQGEFKAECMGWKFHVSWDAFFFMVFGSKFCTPEFFRTLKFIILSIFNLNLVFLIKLKIKPKCD